MNEYHQRAPNLEEMDEQQTHRFLTELFSDLSAEHEYAIRHEDYIMQMPQSGEFSSGAGRGCESSKRPTLAHRLLGCAGCW